jgi:hypothetical protein
VTQVARRDADALVVSPVAVSYRLGTPLNMLPGRTPFATGEDVLDLLSSLARAGQREQKQRAVDWRVDEIDGVHAVFRPTNEPDLAERSAFDLVQGLAMAESQSALDPSWDLQAAKVGARMTRRLGGTPDTGMSIDVAGTDAQRQTTVVTRRAAQHLDEATRLTVTSYGSITGFLGGVSFGKRRRASLWNDIDGRRVEVQFGDHHVEDVRRAWAHPHVEITGWVHENSVGQVLRVIMESLHVPEPSGLKLVDLPAGGYPEMTGGLSTNDYLDLIRGES